MQTATGQGQQAAAVATAQSGVAPAARGITTFRVGKLIVSEAQMLCLVRSISATFIAVDIDVPFQSSPSARLQIGRQRIAGELVRISEKRAHILAAEPIDVERILADRPLLEGGGRRGSPRIRVQARARLQIGEQFVSVDVRDVSSEGMKVFTEEVICEGDRPRIAIKGFDVKLSGVVRWCDGDYAGIEFDRPIAFAQLNAWAAGRSAPALADDEEREALPIISKS